MIADRTACAAVRSAKTLLPDFCFNVIHSLNPLKRDDERAKGHGSSQQVNSKVIAVNQRTRGRAKNSLAFFSTRFYRAMHYSAKRGLAIASRLSVRPSVRPSVRLSDCP